MRHASLLFIAASLVFRKTPIDLRRQESIQDRKQEILKERGATRKSDT